MCFYAMRSKKELDCLLTSGDITLPHAKKAEAMQKQEKNHTDPTNVLAYNDKNWPKIMEVLETHIEGYRAQDSTYMN